MIVNLLTEHHLEFLSLKEAAQARLSLHLSKCHIVRNHVPLPTLCVRAVITLAKLCICAGLSESSLLANLISIKISRNCSNLSFLYKI